jgi:glutamate 5-kinase
VLLTAADLGTPERARYVSDTLGRLLAEPRVLPIINENDSVAVEELKFGDNDMLSVRVAKLAGAKRVILLTSVDGLLDPETDALIPEVPAIDEVFRHVRSDKGRFSMGGMASKLSAVKFAVEAGIETHIAHGRHPERLAGIVAGRRDFHQIPRGNRTLLNFMSTIQETIHQMGRQARAAAYQLAQLSADEKNAILRAMAAAIRKATPELAGSQCQGPRRRHRKRPLRRHARPPAPR